MQSTSIHYLIKVKWFDNIGGTKLLRARDVKRW
jgi:hypothetical protein